MGHALIRPRPSVDDFLAGEPAQAERHAFVGGEVFARVGARRIHGLVGLDPAAPAAPGG